MRSTGRIIDSRHRWPPYQVVPFGSEFIVRCGECGDLEQVHSVRSGRWTGHEHQRWSHPTEEEQEADRLRDYEFSHMDGYCPRCGHEGHDGKDCPNVHPGLLKGTP